MDRFWEAMKESTISQSILTVGIWGAVIYLVCTQQPVPEVLSVGASAILGYWFGSKNQYQLSQVRKNVAAQFQNEDTRSG
jgi:uncharacterized membrane protein YfcA